MNLLRFLGSATWVVRLCKYQLLVYLPSKNTGLVPTDKWIHQMNKFLCATATGDLFRWVLLLLLGVCARN